MSKIFERRLTKRNGGNGSKFYTLTIPVDIVRELEITEENLGVLVSSKDGVLTMKSTKENYYFVGGYYESIIFENGEFENTQLVHNPAIYTLEEVLKLAYVEDVVENYNLLKEDDEKDFYNLNREGQKRLIIEYVGSDELSHLEVFEKKNSAEKYLKELINESNVALRMIRDGIYSSSSCDQEDREIYTRNTITSFSTTHTIESLTCLKDLVNEEFENLQDQSSKFKLDAHSLSDYETFLENKSVSFDWIDETYINICFDIVELNEEDLGYTTIKVTSVDFK